MSIASLVRDLLCQYFLLNVRENILQRLFSPLGIDFSMPSIMISFPAGIQVRDFKRGFATSGRAMVNDNLFSAAHCFRDIVAEAGVLPCINVGEAFDLRFRGGTRILL